MAYRGPSNDPLGFSSAGARPGLTRQGSSTGLVSSSSHLRQRSTGSPRVGTFPNNNAYQNENANPFDDRHAPPLVPMPVLPEPTPHRAALMASASQSSLLPNDQADAGKGQAMLMRGPKAEWTPTQQYLYSASSLQGSATGGLAINAVRGSPSSSAHGSPNASLSPAGSSSSRFEVTPDDFLFVSATYPEDDDELHGLATDTEKFQRVGPDRRLVEPTNFKRGQGLLSWSGFLNLAAVIVILLALIFAFAGLPIWQWIDRLEAKTYGATGLGGVNGTGQVPDLPSFRGLIDKDTPESALTKKSFLPDGKDLKLVFSDEFNEPGRIFDKNMDPYFEAVDLHYWQTNNIEWYDPGNAYTEDGFLTLELTKEDNDTSHGFGYIGAMLMSWNQFCFVGGYIEVAVSLPGSVTVSGLWPAAWLMSNLGRAGYGGSLDGTWPYVYDECDLGTLPNQTLNGQPDLPASDGDQYNNGDLSHLKGQRFSRCTCSSETDHPGPQYGNGTWKGRGASELDIFEATVDATNGIGEISQSAQWAPFNPGYAPDNSTTELMDFYDTDFLTEHNSYLGGSTQQVTSGLSHTDPDTYDSTTNFMKYGLEFFPSDFEGWGNGRATWTQNDEKMWTISDQAMKANSEAMVGNRVITAEPMYILLNLGMSENFGYVDLDNLVFPSKMRVDYVRVYQDSDYEFIGCDPKDNPTVEYIKNNPELYNNPNITVLADADRVFPKNSLVDTC
ncbi:hypothetical protein JCM8547_002058 [Rhodosporidiobolus lusitaniae]